MALPNTKDVPQEDGGYWLVGFNASAAEGARYMSGLVDIIDVQVDVARHSVLFVVRNKDTSNVLFKTGLLKAQKIATWEPEKKQELSVECRRYA